MRRVARLRKDRPVLAQERRCGVVRSDGERGERRTWTVESVLALSWLGMAIHTAIELPGLSVLHMENAGPAVVAVLLFFAWRRGPSRRVASWFLVGWALLHLVGGAVLSVLPLPFLPFEPEQSVAHYASHVVYGLAQVPLLVVGWREAHEHAPVRS